MLFRTAAIFVIGALLRAPSLQAQDKTPVVISASSKDDDIVGKQFIFAVKDAIRGSNGYRLVENTKNWPYIKVLYSSLRVVSGASVIGYAIVFDDLGIPMSGALIFSGVQVCPSNQVDSCARTAMANLEDAVSDLRTNSPEYIQRLRQAKH